MGHQANKPGGNYLHSGEVRNVADLQAVKNQAVVQPDDYPEKASGALLDGRDHPERYARPVEELAPGELGRLAEAERDAGVPDLPTAKAAADAAEREDGQREMQGGVAQ